jgi:CyaY protein
MADVGDFVRHAEAFMKDLQARLDAFDPDELEADLGSGVLKIAFADGKSCVVNRQTAAAQIWLAEGASAWHFQRSKEGEWIDTKGRGSLNAVLGEVLSRRLQRPIEL